VQARFAALGLAPGLAVAQASAGMLAVVAVVARRALAEAVLDLPARVVQA